MREYSRGYKNMEVRKRTVFLAKWKLSPCVMLSFSFPLKLHANYLRKRKGLDEIHVMNCLYCKIHPFSQCVCVCGGGNGFCVHKISILQPEFLLFQNGDAISLKRCLSRIIRSKNLSQKWKTSYQRLKWSA